MPEEKESEEQKEGKFNIAVSYLMSINEILKDIKNISLRTSKNSPDVLSTGRGQKLKLKLVRNLFVQASALIKENEITKKIWEDIKSIKIKLEDTNKNDYNKNHSHADWKIAFVQSTEDKLDELIISIQKELQKSKYFMPLKDEQVLF